MHAWIDFSAVKAIIAADIRLLTITKVKSYEEFIVAFAWK